MQERKTAEDLLMELYRKHSDIGQRADLQKDIVAIIEKAMHQAAQQAFEEAERECTKWLDGKPDDEFERGYEKACRQLGEMFAFRAKMYMAGKEGE